MQSFDILAGLFQHTYISSNYNVYPYKISAEHKQFTWTICRLDKWQPLHIKDFC